MKTVAGGELESLYREQGARMWRAVALYAGDPEVASDAVAEAFAQALGRGEQIHHLSGWVWKAAFRIAAGELKSRSGHQEIPDVSEPAYEIPEDAARLMKALARLSSKQRAAVVLHYYGGYPQTEIATILGSSASTVGVHLHRGRKRLRSILEANDA